MKKQPDNLSALNLLSVPVVIFNNNTVFFLNEKAKELLKIPNTTKELNKLNPFDFILPEFHKRIKKNNNKILKGQIFSPIELKIKNFKGKIIHIEAKSNAVNINGVKAVQSVFYDITERKQLYNELEQANFILNLVGNNKTDIIFKCDCFPNNCISYISDSVYSILGYKPEYFYSSLNNYFKLFIDNTKKINQNTIDNYKKSIINNKKIITKVLSKNKKEIWLETIHSLVKDKKGKLISIIGISRDITKEKEIEAKLNITQEQLSLIAENSHDIIYFFTYQPKPKYLFISNSVEKVLGYKPASFYKDPYFFNKKSVGKTNPLKQHEKIADKEQLKGYIPQKKLEFQVLNSKGKPLWMEDHINPVYDDKGNISFLFGIVRNIEKLKEKELELEQKWSDYKLLLDHSPIAFFIHLNGTCLMCNKAALDILKLKEEKQVIGQVLIKYLVEEQRPRAMQRMKQAMKGKDQPFMGYSIFNSKKEIVNVEIKTVPIFYNGQKCTLSLVKDITEREFFQKSKIKAELAEAHNKKLIKEIDKRIKAESRVIEQKNKLTALFENSSHYIWTVDNHNKLTSFNKNYIHLIKTIYGTEPSIGKSLNRGKMLADKKYIANMEKNYKRVFNGEKSNFELELIDKENNKIFLEVFLSPIYNENKIIEISGIAHNVTEKRMAVLEMKESEQRSRAIVNSIPDLLFTLDKKGIFLNFKTDNNVDLFFKPEDFIGKAVTSLFEDELGEEFKKLIVKAINTGLIQDYNYAYFQKDKTYHYETRFIRINENECLVLIRDITAAKTGEEKLTQSLREKEVLLKEVHHRVKNNMQIISSILNLQSSYTTDKSILNLLRESQNRIKTMAYIHESLYQNKTFSSINFNDYLSQLTNNIIHSFLVSPEKMKLIVDCEKTILNLDVSIPLGLIINELVTNSIKHAFPAASKGIISISLKTQNKYVFLTVEDNGIGVDSNLRPDNSGSLGLQLVHTLVDQIGGSIEFESTKPHGTRASIKFLI